MKKIILTILFGVFLSIPALAAVEAPKLQIPIPFFEGFTSISAVKGNASGDTIQIPWLAEYLLAFYRIAYVVSGIVAVITIIIGGFIWSSSMGNQNRIAQAKDMITSALIGLAIILLSYTILYTINPALTTLKGLTVKTAVPLETAESESPENNTPSDNSGN